MPQTFQDRRCSPQQHPVMVRVMPALPCYPIMCVSCSTRPCPVVQTTAAGLIVPVGGNKAMQDALIGTVVSVGEDVKLSLESGDVVIFSKCVPVTRYSPKVQ